MRGGGALVISLRDLELLAMVHAVRDGILPLGRVHEVRAEPSRDGVGIMIRWKPRHDLTAP